MNMIYTYLGNETQLVQNVNVAGCSKRFMTRFITLDTSAHLKKICVCCFVIFSLCSFSKCVDTQHSTSAKIMTEN